MTSFSALSLTVAYFGYFLVKNSTFPISLKFQQTIAKNNDIILSINNKHYYLEVTT